VRKITRLFVLPNLLGVLIKYVFSRKEKPMDNKNRKEYYGVEQPFYKAKELATTKSFWQRHRWKFIVSAAITLMAIFASTSFFLLRMMLQSAPDNARLTQSSIATPPQQADSGLPCNVNIGAWTSGSPDWVVHNGILYNDGSNRSDSPTMIAPCLPNTTNYAVEAKIQLTNLSGSCFGIMLRGSSTQNGWQGYQAGICNNMNMAYIAAYGDQKALAMAPFAPGTIMRTYRCVVKDNTIKLFIDGTLVVTAHDNRLLTAHGNEQVGLYTQNVQLQVSRFQVTAL
jgi:hypothetical protein